VRYLARPWLSPPTRPGASVVDDEFDADEDLTVDADPEEPVEYVVVPNMIVKELWKGGTVVISS
jgi:hypothetical protein